MKIMAMSLALALSFLPAWTHADAAAAPAGNLLLDDFEGNTKASNGQSWWTGCDKSGLGTTLAPQPFVPQAGGSRLSPGHSGRIHGHLGKNVAPWPWANMTLGLAPQTQDIRGYRFLRFYAKGDGGTYQVWIRRAAVKDFCFHRMNFTAPATWTLVTLPLSGFAQPTWGAAVPAEFSDVAQISLLPTATDANFDLSIDDLTLVR